MAHSDIITQNEIDALLDILDSDDAIFEEQNKTFNFHKELKSNRQKFDTLHKIHTLFVSNLLSNINNIAKKRFNTLKLKSIKEYATTTLLNQNDIIKFDKRLNFINSDIKILLKKETLDSIIDIYLGGEGVVNSPKKEPSKIEMTLFDYFLNDFVTNLTKSWKSIKNIKEITKNQSKSIINNFDNIIKINFELTLSKETHTITLLYPTKLIENIILKSINFENFNKKEFKQELKKIDSVELNMDIVVGSLLLSVKELKELKIGTVLKINRFAEDKTLIYVENREFFYAKYKKKSAIINKIIGKKYE